MRRIRTIFGWVDGEGIVGWPSFRWGGRISLDGVMGGDSLVAVVPMGRENIFGWIDGEEIVWWSSFRWGGRISLDGLMGRG